MKINSNKRSKLGKKGFTLIEMLVAVLIIGILVAICLPQYYEASIKTKFTKMRQVVDIYAREFEIYKFAHDQYPPNGWIFRDEINVDFSNCKYLGGDYLGCDGFRIDAYEHNNQNIIANDADFQYGYAKWFNDSKNLGRKECLACESNSHAIKMCQSFGGSMVRSVQYGSSCKMLAFSIP